MYFPASFGSDCNYRIIIIIIRNLYSAIMPLGGHRGAGNNKEANRFAGKTTLVTSFMSKGFPLQRPD